MDQTLSVVHRRLDLSLIRRVCEAGEDGQDSVSEMRVCANKGSETCGVGLLKGLHSSSLERGHVHIPVSSGRLQNKQQNTKLILILKLALSHVIEIDINFNLY